MLLDGTAPGADHGDDVDEAGNGTLVDQRLYQLIRQADTGGNRLFEIEFLAAGAEGSLPLADGSGPAGQAGRLNQNVVRPSRDSAPTWPPAASTS